MRSFFSHSFGCRVNWAEMEKINQELLKFGLKFDTNQPDICIVNTCSVTAKAQREARQLIYQLKRKYPQAKIVVTGCSATFWKKNKETGNLPIDLLIDNKDKKNLSSLLLSLPDLRGRGRPVPTIRGTTNFDKFINSGRQMIKIQDGCQRFCSYCIVPYLRGKPKSKKIRSLELEVKSLGKNIKEVILTAINTEAFGQDTGEKFIDLIKAVLEKTKVQRLSFGSINPWSITPDFLKYYKTIAASQRFVHFFHIPIQSGSNKMLELMKRGYTKEEIMQKLVEIKKLNPMAFLATDVIVGFLDETDIDFKETYEFLEKSPFDKFHVFRFSQRKGTAAYFMAKRLKEPQSSQKIKRSKALIELGKKKYQGFLEKHLGQTFPALFLEEKIEDYQKVLLNNQIPALIKTDKNLAGHIKEVKITELKNGVLCGR